MFDGDSEPRECDVNDFVIVAEGAPRSPWEVSGRCPALTDPAPSATTTSASLTTARHTRDGSARTALGDGLSVTTTPGGSLDERY